MARRLILNAKMISLRRKTKYSLNGRKYLQPSEFDRLEVLLSGPGQCRNRLILRMAVCTGARASEILNIEKRDLNPDAQSVFIRGLKGSNDRELPLTTDFFLELQRYAKTIAGARLFPIGYHRLRDIWAFYRPVEKRFGTLRHTFAIRLYSATLDLRLVQAALGHRSITNTMIYAEYHYTLEELKRIKIVAI